MAWIHIPPYPLYLGLEPHTLGQQCRHQCLSWRGVKLLQCVVGGADGSRTGVHRGVPNHSCTTWNYPSVGVPGASAITRVSGAHGADHEAGFAQVFVGRWQKEQGWAAPHRDMGYAISKQKFVSYNLYFPMFVRVSCNIFKMRSCVRTTPFRH